MENVLLINKFTISQIAPISKNLSEKELNPAIISAQERDLQQLIGTSLYRSICAKVSSGDILDPEFVHYKDLLDNYISVYLVYAVLADLQMPISYKERNKGTVQLSDERIEPASLSELQYLKNYYKSIADFFGSRISKQIKDHKSFFPEYSCSCNDGLGANPDYLKDFPIAL